MDRGKASINLQFQGLTDNFLFIWEHGKGGVWGGVLMTNLSKGERAQPFFLDGKGASPGEGEQAAPED